MLKKVILDETACLGLTAKTLEADFTLARDEKALEGEDALHLVSLET